MEVEKSKQNPRVGHGRHRRTLNRTDADTQTKKKKKKGCADPVTSQRGAPRSGCPCVMPCESEAMGPSGGGGGVHGQILLLPWGSSQLGFGSASTHAADGGGSIGIGEHVRSAFRIKIRAGSQVSFCSCLMSENELVLQKENNLSNLTKQVWIKQYGNNV